MSNEELGTEMTQKKSECGKVVFWVAVILVLVFLTRVIVPCAGVRLALDLFIPDVGAGAEYFTEYDVRDDSLVMTDSHLNIGIPERCVKLEKGLKADVYGPADGEQLGIIIMPAYDLSDMDLYNRDMYEDISDGEYKLLASVLDNWFDELGYGYPNSGYGTQKCIHLLDDGDRSFWNIGKNIAFAVTGVLKLETAIFGDEVYIYETDDKCGIISVSDHETDGGYYVIAEMYDTEDLGMSYSVMIRGNDLQEIYSIINSITIE